MLSDGDLASNVATLSLTVTSVNDAPMVSDQAPSVAEDGALVVDGLVTAADESRKARILS
jgi:hypothetical protein